MELGKGQRRSENDFVWEIKSFCFRSIEDVTKRVSPFQGKVKIVLNSTGIVSVSYDGIHWVPVVERFHPSSFSVKVLAVAKKQRGDAEVGFRLCIENGNLEELWTAPVLTAMFDNNREVSAFSIEKQIPKDLLCYMLVGFLERREKYFFRLIFFKDGIGEMPLEPKTSSQNGITDRKADGTESLSKHLSHLLIEDGDNDHDVTIKVKDRELKAHRLILKARSPVFKSMFGRETAERNTGLVQIDDCDPDAFADFLLYLYSGGVTLTGRNVANLYRIADKYAVVDLAKSCADYMIDNFTVQSVTDYLSLAAMHNEAGVLEIGIEFMGQHLKEVLNTKEWKDFISGNPLQGNEIISKAVSFIS